MSEFAYIVLDHAIDLRAAEHGVDGYGRAYVLASPALLDNLLGDPAKPQAPIYRRGDMPAGWPAKWAVGA